MNIANTTVWGIIYTEIATVVSHIELLINGRLKLALYPTSSAASTLIPLPRLLYIFPRNKGRSYIHVSLTFHLCFGC